MNKEVEIYIGGNLYRLEEDDSGCSKCALRKECLRGKEIYKSRAWLCQILSQDHLTFSQRKDYIFVQVHGVTINKEENYAALYS